MVVQSLADNAEGLSALVGINPNESLSAYKDVSSPDSADAVCKLL